MASGLNRASGSEIALRDGAPKLTPTPADIDKDASKVKVVAVDASQTPNAYNEGRPAVINNNWLQRAGIDPGLRGEKLTVADFIRLGEARNGA